jgi:class 3 adenylate cyclase
MFVDLRSSTSIAERLGHERYSAFLRDFFNDVADAIHRTRGEVYQYVGDEIVIVWPGDRGSSRWLACFESMRDALAAAAAGYQARYGAVPEFKAGVHGGQVVVTEVGTLRRAHVYHGDVLNAASRIQAKCNETGFGLLASKEVVARMSPGDAARFDEVGDVLLEGKSEGVIIYGLRH